MSTAEVANQEKNSAALNSVLAAVALTSFKLIVGVMTNSLGILAEAAHSGLDLVAALATFFGVRISGKPADEGHHYGHGKVENLTALFEAILLLVTSGWIIYEAVQRIWYTSEPVDASIWAFLVMATSIAVDVSRSRMLYRAARKHNSQALEADALHFSTDIWSSAVVLLGLGLVRAAEFLPQFPFLAKADSVAALGVALIVIYVSGELGVRTIHGLLDSAPVDTSLQVQQIAVQIPGVTNAHGVRVRPSGPELFIDLHIRVSPQLSVVASHQIVSQVESAIMAEFPRADVIVHVDPDARPG